MGGLSHTVKQRLLGTVASTPTGGGRSRGGLGTDLRHPGNSERQLRGRAPSYTCAVRHDLVPKERHTVRVRDAGTSCGTSAGTILGP